MATPHAFQSKISSYTKDFPIFTATGMSLLESHNIAYRSEYGDSAKYVIFTTADKKGNDTNGKIKVTMNDDLIKKSLELAGYNMLVTSEISMADKEIYTAYHNLWRIEESFRIMKSQLDARPVYLQKKDTITGHFLICYLAVLLTRLLQFKIVTCSHHLNL